MVSSNIVTSAVGAKERWLKLYRKIHHLFLKDEFIHTVDYNKMVLEMNARILELEGKLTVELLKIQLGLMTHVHQSPPAPVNPVITSPPAKPPYTNSFTNTKPVIVSTLAMQQTDAALQATGPGVAPLGDGLTVASVTASTTAILDRGL